MAGLIYVCGFQVGGASGGMTLTTLGSGATVASGYYMPGSDYGTSYAQQTPDVNSWTGQAYTAFTSALKTALDATGTGTWTVSFSESMTYAGGSTGPGYTLSTNGAAVALDFDTGAVAGNLRLGLALGMISKLAATTFLSNRRPYYVMQSAIGARTNVQGPFEPDDIAEESVSDGGVDYVITRKTTERLMSWDQAMEPRTSVYPFANNVGGTPGSWTWEDWFRHVRGTHPFVCVDAIEGEPVGAYYRYTAKGAAHRPRRFMPDFDDYWVIPHEARWLAAREPP